MIAITYETQDPDVDIHDLINYVRANGPGLRADESQIGFYAVSANTQTALAALTDSSAEYRDSLACAVMYYGDMFFVGDLGEQLSPHTPLFIVKAGRDDFALNISIDRFVEAAREEDIPLEYYEYEDGIHGFDYWQDTDESREIVKQTVEFMKTHLFEE